MTFRSAAAAALVASVVPLVMVATAPTALACSCAIVGGPAQIDSATVVFSGRALSHDEGAGAVVSSADPVPWTFAVDRVYRGTAAARQVVVTARSSASCGAELLDGREYLVFGSGDPVSTTLCGGTQELAGVPADVTAALGPGTAIEPPEPPPAPSEPPVWPAFVAGVVVVGALVGLLVRRRRAS